MNYNVQTRLNNISLIIVCPEKFCVFTEIYWYSIRQQLTLLLRAFVTNEWTECINRIYLIFEAVKHRIISVLNNVFMNNKC